MSTQRHIFLGGLHRSGTSILHRCLCDHPDVSGFQATGVPEDEGQHLQSVYPTALACGGPGRFGFNSASFMDEGSALVSHESRAQLLIEWGLYWDSEAPILVEKSPPNLVRARFLQALFPEARFVLLLRHPLAVSYATQKWSKTSLNSLLAHWLACHRRFLRDLPYLKSALVLRYEDLVDSPEATLARVYRFAGIVDHPLQQCMCRDLNAQYFMRWRQALLSGDVRGRMLHSALVLKYEMQVRRFGYSLLRPNSTACWGAGKALGTDDG